MQFYLIALLEIDLVLGERAIEKRERDQAEESDQVSKCIKPYQGDCGNIGGEQNCARLILYCCCPPTMRCFAIRVSS